MPRFFVRWISKRYVAGENLADAVAVMESLNSKNTCFTVDVLGEEINSISEASYFINEYNNLLNAIVEKKIDANISIKPTALGLLLDEKKTRENLQNLLDKAALNDIFVRLDMEDSRVTKSTIDLVYTMHNKGYKNVGTVLQARLFRTPQDIVKICSKLGYNADFRICKGIYLEPNNIAFTDYQEIVKSTNTAIDSMLEKGAYVAIASHDDGVINHTLNSLTKYDMIPGKSDPRDNAGPKLIGKGNGYEFQFLLGVRGDIRRKLANEGHLTRIYLPYGSRWYEYSMRRLRENPEIATHVAKAFFLPWTNRR
jgi:proline dehydrogenase